MPKYWTKMTFNMTAAAILDFCTNNNNSATDWRKLTKFCANVACCYWNLVVWPKWTKITNLRQWLLPFWILFIAHNSFTIACICAKFGMSIKWCLFGMSINMPKYSTKKSEMATATILDFCTNSNNLAADWHRLMKFCSNIVGCYQK